MRWNEVAYEMRWNEVAQIPPETLVRNVLVNDQDCNSEHVLSVIGHTPPQNGVINMNVDGVAGKFEYTPNQGYRGPEMMFYIPYDGYVSASAPLSIYVYWPDIDVDSDNSGMIHRGNYPGAPDDPIETHSNKPGKIVAVNDDDDNGNGVMVFMYAQAQLPRPWRSVDGDGRVPIGFVHERGGMAAGWGGARRAAAHQTACAMRGGPSVDRNGGIQTVF